MKFNFETPNMVDFGVNSRQIVSNAQLSRGVDATPAFDAMQKIAINKMQSEKRMALMKNEANINKVLNNYATSFNDPNMYKDEKQYNSQLGSFKKEFSKYYDGVLDINMSEEERETVLMKYDSLREKLENSIKAKKKSEEFKQQQQEMSVNVSEATNRIMSNAYSGNSNFLDADYSFVEGIMKDQVSKGLVTKEQSNEFLSEIITKGTIISSTKSEINSIIASDIDDRLKVKQLKQLKNKYSDDDFIKNLSKEASRGTALSKETTEMGLRKYKGMVEKMANMEINHISNDFKVKSVDLSNMRNNIKKLSLKDKDEFKNLIFNGKKFEAYQLYAEKTGEILEFRERDDFYKNKFIQEDTYGTTFNLSDINDNRTPSNTLPEEAINNISSISNDPLSQLNLSTEEFNSLSPQELQEMTFKKSINTVKFYMGTDDEVSAMKYLIGQNIEPIQFLQNGQVVSIPLNDMATAKALVDEGTPTSVKNRLLEEANINASFATVIGNIENYEAAEKEDKKSAIRVEMANHGIAIPKNAIDGKEELLIRKKDFKSGGFLAYNFGETFSDTFKNLYPNISDSELAREFVETSKELTTSESAVAELYNYAVTIYNTGGYVDAKDLTDGITKTNLVTKRVNGETAFEKAMKLFIRKQRNIGTIGSQPYQPLK